MKKRKGVVRLFGVFAVFVGVILFSFPPDMKGGGIGSYGVAVIRFVGATVMFAGFLFAI